MRTVAIACLVCCAVVGAVGAQPAPGGPVGGVRVDGRWTTNIGLEYDLVQTGDGFVWGVVGRAPEGDGRVDGVAIHVRSVVDGRQFSVSGSIGVDAHGRAVEIRMSNGVIFARQLPPVAVVLPAALVPGPAGSVGPMPGVVRVDGRWHTNIGLEYEIVQATNRFSWGVVERGPEGTGRIDGLTVSVEWATDGVPRSVTGAVSLDAHGRAIRIEMENGVLFWRQLPVLVDIVPGSIVIDPDATPSAGREGEPASPDVIPIGIP